MPLKALILLTLLSRTPFHQDTESWIEREGRLVDVSHAIISAADLAVCYGEGDTAIPDGCKRIWPDSRKSLAILLVEQAISESDLSHRIQDNECRLEIGECDARRDWDYQEKRPRYTQRAFSLWQLQYFGDIPKAHWEAIQMGRPGTAHAAWHAARRLSSARRDCSDIQGAIARYATGNGCEWSGAEKRLRLYNSLMSANPESMKRTKEILRDRVNARVRKQEQSEESEKRIAKKD